MMVSNDTSLCSRKSGLESQRSDSISFNAAVGNQQVQSSGVPYPQQCSHIYSARIYTAYNPALGHYVAFQGTHNAPGSCPISTLLLCYCLCFLIPSWDCNSVLGEMVCDHQYVFGVTLVWFQGEEIHADQLQGSACLDVHKGSRSLLRSFSADTAFTRLYLFFYIHGHFGPVESRSYKVESSLHTQVAQVVM